MLVFLLLAAAALAPVVDRPGAKPDAPVVVGLHGRGDTPENFSHVADALGPQFHWRFPRGPLPWKADLQGSQWFNRDSPDHGNAALAEAIRLVAAELKAAGNKPKALVGFSQGCMLAAQYVAARPDEVRAVLCFGGALHWGIHVPAGKHAVQIRFVHGRNDPLVPFAKAQEAVKLLRQAGLDATLTEHPGGHVIPPALVPELRAWLAERLK